MPILPAANFESLLSQHSHAHLLQSSAWGELKSCFGWQPYYFQAGKALAQVLIRRLPLGFTFGYIPKGPTGNNWADLWPEIDRLCRSMRAIFLKVEPDAWEPPDQALLAELSEWTPARPIQPRRTIMISLDGDESQWLERMKQKTRYNIRLAERKDVAVHVSTDLPAFHRMMLATGSRDGFSVHSLDYLQRAYDIFAASGDAVLLTAVYEERPLAGLMVFARAARAWYFYGASTGEERNRMPAYLLQWEAMHWAARRGCRWYDLWGVPDAEESELEAGFMQQSDGLWGVYRFKRGFGGELKRSVGAWDRVYQPLAYRFIQAYLARRESGGG
ncbi:MAG TPA: peptidoglycan bridge formation glycyltransferase FemA/FemB family protein [Levilinea sp.]|nr:peptidoglycan bridge formation glycyltransferase FemA/FemB family protein [Levilinea sp.]